MPRIGLHIPDVAHIVVDGIQLTLEPGVKPEAMILSGHHVDTIMAHIKDTMVKTLDGTQAKEAADFKEMLDAGKIQPHPYDPVRCPERPTAEELYPFGYNPHGWWIMSNFCIFAVFEFVMLEITGIWPPCMPLIVRISIIQSGIFTTKLMLDVALINPE